VAFQDTMLGCAARKAVAALRAVPKGSGIGSSVACPRGSRLLTRPGEQHHGLCSALALAVVPAQLLPGMSLGGGARSAGTDAVSSIAMGRGVRSGWGGVSRRLVSSTSGSAGGSMANALPEDRPEGGGNEDSVEAESRRFSKEISHCTDATGILGLVEQHGESFNVMHVSVAWGKLAKMRGGDGTGDSGLLLQRLQDMVRAKRDW